MTTSDSPVSKIWR